MVDCCMWKPPPPLPCLSRHSMTLSSHHGRRHRTTATPAEPMPGGHRVVIALPHRRRIFAPHRRRATRNDWRSQHHCPPPAKPPSVPPSLGVASTDSTTIGWAPPPPPMATATTLRYLSTLPPGNPEGLAIVAPYPPPARLPSKPPTPGFAIADSTAIGWAPPPPMMTTAITSVYPSASPSRDPEELGRELPVGCCFSVQSAMGGHPSRGHPVPGCPCRPPHQRTCPDAHPWTPPGKEFSPETYCRGG